MEYYKKDSQHFKYDDSGVINGLISDDTIENICIPIDMKIVNIYKDDQVIGYKFVGTYNIANRFTLTDAISYKNSTLERRIPILYNEIIEKIKKDIDNYEKVTTYIVNNEEFNILEHLFIKDGYKISNYGKGEKKIITIILP